jgi:hypothetical protein
VYPVLWGKGVNVFLEHTASVFMTFHYNFNYNFIYVLNFIHRKIINIFERKVYRRISGPVYDNFKENFRTLTNKEIYAMLKNPL